MSTSKLQADARSNVACAAARRSIASTPQPDLLGCDSSYKEFATLQAQFALRGYVLNRAYRVPDGRITYTVDRGEQCRAFSHLHDVQAFLNQVTGAAL